jgi:hypothetical protein
VSIDPVSSPPIQSLQQQQSPSAMPQLSQQTSHQDEHSHQSTQQTLQAPQKEGGHSRHSSVGDGHDDFTEEDRKIAMQWIGSYRRKLRALLTTLTALFGFIFFFALLARNRTFGFYSFLNLITFIICLIGATGVWLKFQRCKCLYTDKSKKVLLQPFLPHALNCPPSSSLIVLSSFMPISCFTCVILCSFSMRVWLLD